MERKRGNICGCQWPDLLWNLPDRLPGKRPGLPHFGFLISVTQFGGTISRGTLTILTIVQ